MRRIQIVLLCAFASILPIAAQTAVTAPRPEAPPALVSALLGHWTGVLEYRDYSEPPASTKRVQLPTWLAVTQAPEGLRLHYVYDDGPNKVVEELSVVAIDAAAHTWKALSTDHVQSFAVAGLEQLKDGRGELILTGQGSENNKPADLRQTIAVRRNLLTILEESRAVNTNEPFAFRHRYVFTRAEPPAVPAPR